MKLQIVRLGFPQKGDVIDDQMSKLCQSTDGTTAMKIEWQRIFFRKNEFFVFERDVVAARIATQEEVKIQAKVGGFGMGGSKLPLGGLIGYAVMTTAAVIGSALHSGSGMMGIVVQYKNSKGYDSHMMVICAAPEFDQIIKSIPAEKIVKLKEGEKGVNT